MTVQRTLPLAWPARATLAGIVPRPRPDSSAPPLLAQTRLDPAVRRLVVLIPDADTDEAVLAAHLWAVASAGGLAVLLLGHCAGVGREPRARRRLAALAALIRDRRVHVETRLEMERGWVQAVRSVHRHSDLVVCHAEQQVAGRGLRREPLSRRLAAALDGPVCVLAGFYPDLPPDLPDRLVRLFHLAMPLLIVAAFTVLELVIHRTTKAAAATVLLSLSVLVEYSLLGVWYSLSR